MTAQVDVLQLDVTNDEQIAAAVKYVEDAYGRLDGQLNSNDLLNRPANNISIQCWSTMRASFVTHPVTETSWAFVRHNDFQHQPDLDRGSYHRVQGTTSQVRHNISSGLGSVTNALTRKIGRAVPYGSSKVGLNGLTVHMQVEENDRTDSERDAPGRAFRQALHSFLRDISGPT